MTERIRFEPKNPDEEPFFMISVYGSEILATRFNVTLKRYLGGLAIHNHILYDEEPFNPNVEQTALFSFVNGFEGAEAFMLENDYPIHDNMTEVSPTVVNAYERAMDEYLDEIPDWME